MQYDEFVQRVQQYAELDSADGAERLTEVVLATLGEQLYRTELAKLEAQLPKDMHGMLFAEQPPEQTRQDVQQVSLEEFYNRVSARADVGYPEATEQAKAVIRVLQEAVSAGEIADVRAKLPDDYAELFGESPTGPAGSTTT